MADVLIMYNIASETGGAEKEAQVTEAMKQLGYRNSFKGKDAFGNPVVQYLPTNTLGKSNATPTQAKNDLLRVAGDCHTDVSRLVATEFETWDALPGKENL